MSIQEYPRVTVGAFIRNHQGQILLCKSPKWEDYWVVCGGHIDMGETTAQALEREVKEEVGLKVKFLRVINPVDFIYNSHFYKKYHFVSMQCECLLIDETEVPQIDGREITKAKWFSVQDALREP
ncbi:MAG: NUDIX domain-containing protein, partial [bacterium]